MRYITNTRNCQTMYFVSAGTVPAKQQEKLGQSQLFDIKSGKRRGLGRNPIISYDDKEIRFHIDTSRIEEYVGEYYAKIQ